MKNETARREIESLDYYLQNHTNDYSEESHMAMMMAIKALEQQTCEDCISREAVIRLVEQYPVIIGNRYSGLIADIKHLPPVTPFTQWTPASQPSEPNTAVLLYVKYKSSGQWTYLLGMWNDSKKAWEDWLTPYRLEDDFEIIEWTDLPERYGGRNKCLNI